MANISITMGRNSKGSIKLKNFDRALPENIERGFNKIGAILQSQIKRHLTGVSATIDKSRSFPGTGVVRGGGLRASVTFKVEKRFKTISLRVGPNKPYAAIHEFGGTIVQTVTPKQRWFLGLSKNIWLKVGQQLVIHIPKRAYVWPAWLKQKRQVMQVIQKQIMGPIRGAR